jgi:hypothetical protein
MLSDRTKVVRGVLAFLGFCAVLGFFMGIRGAMPGNVDPDYDSAPLSTPSGVVVEATPVGENALVTPNDMALNEEAKEEAEEEEKEATPEPAPPTLAPEPSAAPKEEAPPADPVGELIAPPAAPPPPGDLY